MSIRNPEIDRLLMEERLTKDQIAACMNIPVEDVDLYIKQTFQWRQEIRNYNSQWMREKKRKDDEEWRRFKEKESDE